MEYPLEARIVSGPQKLTPLTLACRGVGSSVKVGGGGGGGKFNLNQGSEGVGRTQGSYSANNSIKNF